MAFRLMRWVLGANTPESRTLISNFFSLSVLQAANYILPFLTLPYLVRVLGYEHFGLLSLATATVTYFQILIEYGFNLSATKEIAIHSANHEKISEIFSAVMLIKIVLTFFSLALLFALSFVVSFISKDWHIYLLSFGVVIGQTFLPIWFFLGMEKMSYITTFNIAAKLIFTGAIFIFVKHTEDFFMVPLITSIGYLIVATWAIIVIIRKFRVKLKRPSYQIIQYHLKTGWHIFISNTAVSLYTLTTTILLGIFTSNLIVGYYSVADKLINAVKNIITPVSQTLYPYINRESLISKPKTLAFISKILIGFGSAMAFGSLIIFFFSKELIELLFGEQSSHSVLVLRILAIIPFLVTLDTVLGTLTMLTFNRSKNYSKIIVSAGFINLVISIFLIQYWHHIGAAISVLIVEVYITLRLLIYVQTSDLTLDFKRL